MVVYWIKWMHSRFQVETQRQFNGVEQVLVIDRFAELGGGPSGQRPGARLIRIVAGDDDNGHTGVGQPGLNVKAAHDGHVQIQHHAIGPVIGERCQKVAAGGKGFHVQTGGAEQARQRFADGFFIIHDGHEGTGFAHNEKP